MAGEETILYEDEPFHGVSVKAASIDQLIDLALKNFGEFQDYFLHFICLESILNSDRA